MWRFLARVCCATMLACFKLKRAYKTMQEILIGGQNGIKVFMDAAMGNRHGMISGATGTGKTITL